MTGQSSDCSSQLFDFEVVELLGQLKLQLPLFDFELEETGLDAVSYSIVQDSI